MPENPQQELGKLMERCKALLPQLNDSSGGVQQNVLNDLINALRKATWIEPGSRQPLLILAQMMTIAIAVQIQENMSGRSSIKFGELPQSVQEKIRFLATEGQGCLIRYRKLKGEITPEYQRLSSELDRYPHN